MTYEPVVSKPSIPRNGYLGWSQVCVCGLIMSGQGGRKLKRHNVLYGRAWQCPRRRWWRFWERHHPSGRGVWLPYYWDRRDEPVV